VYIITVSLGKDIKHATCSRTATHANVTGLTASSENVGHKLYMDNLFSSLALIEDLHTKTINCCVTISSNRNWMLKNFGQKIKLKQDDIKTR
jgi:tetrahydromethanopterin S-methyltransferase subunit E